MLVENVVFCKKINEKDDYYLNNCIQRFIYRSMFTCFGPQNSTSQTGNIRRQKTSLLETPACRGSTEPPTIRLSVQCPGSAELHLRPALLGGHSSGKTLLDDRGDHRFKPYKAIWELLLQPGCEQHILVHLSWRWTVPGMSRYPGEAAVGGKKGQEAGRAGKHPEGGAAVLWCWHHGVAPLLLCAVLQASVPHV